MSSQRVGTHPLYAPPAATAAARGDDVYDGQINFRSDGKLTDRYEINSA